MGCPHKFNANRIARCWILINFSWGTAHFFAHKKKKKSQIKWSFNNKQLIIYTIWNDLLQHLKENIHHLKVLLKHELHLNLFNWSEFAVLLPLVPPRHARCLTCPSLVPTFPFLSGLVLQQEIYFLSFSSSLCHNRTEQNWQWGSQSNLWTLISFLFLSCSTYLLKTSQTMW